mmetsp:Transcript_26457/g.35262  ORF Transcript_26457/g.35262 Transcript_26457/m.35262 type:complete len:97 (+) Transcript_26457:237-527(+)
MGGNDEITLGDGDDIAFGGADDDIIYGGNGQDIILGDFGRYNASYQFLPGQFFESIIEYSENAGLDVLFGGNGDDILMGQEKNDTIFGEGGSDDCY